MATPQSGSLLLALPMELLQRITVHLDDDQYAILSVRLTCKTLEAATFDCFAEEFFGSHQYCILYRSQTDLKSAQIAAMRAYSQDQVEMLQTQILPDAELIRSVLVALRAKCPGVELDLSIRKNARSSIPVHAKVLEAVAVLGIALTRLAVVPTTLASADFGTLQPGLSACASSLVKFCFADNNISMASAESQTPASTRSRLLHSVLGSADALRDLTLNLAHPSDRWGWGTGGLTSDLLLTSSYPMLQSLSLTALPVTERAILNTLANCGGQLEKVNFRVVHLTDIEGDGWADVLSTLAALPKLCEVALYALYGCRNTLPHVYIDLQGLKHGQTTFSRAGAPRTHNNVLFFQDEVAAGLQELLDGDLKYY